jgi:hypothetical protein
MFRARRRTQVRPSFIAIGIVFAIYFIFFAFRDGHPDVDEHDRSVVHPGSAAPEKAETKKRQDLVVASMKGDDTEWLFEHFPNWNKNIYVVNDEKAELTVEKNKGRESMVYLRYDHNCIRCDSQMRSLANLVFCLALAISSTTTTTFQTICSSYTHFATNGITMIRSMTAYLFSATSRYHT